MELSISGSKTGLSVSDDVFAQEFRGDLIHQVVTAFRAAGRAGTKAQKTRSDVSGGGRKPFKQKGTGSARAGTTRGPLWRKGGVTFAARPRDFSQKVNKKMFRGAMASILSELVRQGRLIVVDSFDVDAPKTKQLVSKLSALDVGRSILITESGSDNLYLAARNLWSFNVLDVAAMDPVSLVGADHVLMTVDAVKKVEEWLA